MDITQFCLQIGFTIILARLLSPVEFGLLAMVMLFVRFVRAMTQVGLGSAVIQSPDITAAQTSAIFISSIAINLWVSLLCFILAPFAAAFFDQPTLIPLIRVVGWIVLIASFAFPEILLRKSMEFRGAALVQIGTMIIGNIVGITMALNNFGVWSLVGSLLVQRTLYSIAIWPVARWCPVLPRFSGIMKLYKFGFYMFGSRLINYFSQNMVAIVAGKFLGIEILGNYNIAFNLAILPAQKVQSILINVLTPTFSRIQTDPAYLKKIFLVSVFSLGLIFVPLMVGLSIIAVDLVSLLFGFKWKYAGNFLSILALVGLLKSFEYLMRSLIISTGRASGVFRIETIQTAISIPLYFLGLKYVGINGLIGALLVVSLISFLLTMKLAQNIIEDRFFMYKAIIRSIIATCFMFIALYAYSNVVAISSLIALGSEVALGALVYGVTRFALLSKRERILMENWPVLPRFLTGKPS